MNRATLVVPFGDAHHPSAPPPLHDDDAHVWRVDLGATHMVHALRPLLSDAERVRADRFHRAEHSHRFTIAHGVLRSILAGYVGVQASELSFRMGVHGKPSLDAHGETVDFNLSHSGNVALVAVTRGRAIGVDVEEWDDRVQYLDVAERFFSPAERVHLRALDRGSVAHGFFSAWSRKEAYLKATGAGITQGLHHFDVSLHHDVPAELLADRLDPDAVTRWQMRALDVGPRYSGA